jgi:predicted phosphodiesterase
MIRDLNTLTGPVLIFGGPYSNLHATTALLELAERRGIPANNMICTGDIIAYAGDPSDTLDAIIHSQVHVVMGNCEESFGSKGDDCGCGFEEGSDCDVLSRQWYAYADSTLSPNQRLWMRGLPNHLRFSLNGYRFAVIHGGVRDISRWIFQSTPEDVKRHEIGELEGIDPVDGVIAGHCGLPFVDNLGDKVWINPGVVGMPANDGTPKTWYAILEPTTDGISIDLQTLDYDFEGAAERMKTLSLATAYAETLVTGLWPNMDVLATEERQQVGEAIEPRKIHWAPSRSVAAE